MFMASWKQWLFYCWLFLLLIEVTDGIVWLDTFDGSVGDVRDKKLGVALLLLEFGGEYVWFDTDDGRGGGVCARKLGYELGVFCEGCWVGPYVDER